MSKNLRGIRKKIVLGTGTVICICVIIYLTTGLFQSEAQKDSEDRQIATVGRRDISASVRATGIIKPMVGAEVRG